jgi:hypothetical protein
VLSISAHKAEPVREMTGREAASGKP